MKHAYISTKQLVILNTISRGYISGKEIRTFLDEHNMKTPRNSFYCYIDKMVQAGLVEKIRIKETYSKKIWCKYVMTKKGLKEHNKICELINDKKCEVKEENDNEHLTHEEMCRLQDTILSHDR